MLGTFWRLWIETAERGDDLPLQPEDGARETRAWYETSSSVSIDPNGMLAFHMFYERPHVILMVDVGPR